ncbi:MAG: 1-deoxy-D-xylulose-5-phosphate reductoisomerase [Planctomycetota bacterium]
MPESDQTRRLIVLGSTGSIGTQTLEVVDHLNAILASSGAQPAFEIVGLACHRDQDLIREQARRWPNASIAVAQLDGNGAAERLVREVECDIVMASIVGIAGLPSTHAAVELGRDVAIANKESLVAAGGVIVPLAQQTGSTLLPVDSEHSALWQCLGPATNPPTDHPRGVRRMILTASGGALRDWDKDRIERATPEEVLAHPNWDMGAKVTTDTATLANKALEILEARWLFGLTGEALQAVIHRQSLVHSFVEFDDGSLLAQIGAHDMRTPIQVALTHPHREPGCADRLDPLTLGRLDFAPPDTDRFPMITLAHEVMRIDEYAGHPTTAGAVFSAANEEAVRAFLDGRVRFGAIPRLVSETLGATTCERADTLISVLRADQTAREHVHAGISALV